MFGNGIDENAVSQDCDFYQESLVLLEGAVIELTSRLDIIRKYRKAHHYRDPIEYCKSRIKSPASMKEKLLRHGLEPTRNNAMTKVYDAAGIRVICAFVDDVYFVAKMLHKQSDIRVLEEKDYIHNPKPNGYRSYHMIAEVPIHLGDGICRVYCEIQIRTIAMDCWASLEHQLKYKKSIANQEMIVGELKRCADEIASADLNLQTIRDMIEDDELRTDDRNDL